MIPVNMNFLELQEGRSPTDLQKHFFEYHMVSELNLGLKLKHGLLWTTNTGNDVSCVTGSQLDACLGVNKRDDEWK